MGKKMISIISISVILAVLLSACASDTTNKQKKESAANDGGKKETITISIGEDDYGAPSTFFCKRSIMPSDSGPMPSLSILGK